MLITTRVQEKGQVTIPQEIRKKLNLKKGDLVTFVETESGIAIKSVDEAADELLEGLRRKLQKRGISLEKLTVLSTQKGGDAAAMELGVSEAEKEIFYQAMRLRAQAALAEIQADAKMNGTDKLTEAEIEAEIQAARREIDNVARP